jgi:cobalt/nickel transport protein
MNNFIGKLIIAVLLSTSSVSVLAHEMWLEPEPFITQSNTDLKAHIKVGQNFSGEKFPYIKSETKSLKLFLTQKEIKLKHRDGDYPAIKFPLTSPGLYVLSYESFPEKVNYANFEKFKSFLEEQNVWDNWSKQNPSFLNTNINELYTRYAKSLIQVGNQTEDDFNTGLTFELIALDNPYKENNKKGINVLLLYKNKPFPNSQIAIFNKLNNSVSVNKVITNKEGKAFVSLENNGLFLISSVHFIKSENKKADWHSLWASLTFSK